MSLFKKITAKFISNDSQLTTNGLSRAGQLAGAEGISSSEIVKKLVPRVDRIRVSANSLIKVILLSSGEALELVNISVSGVALASGSFEMGDLLDCELHLPGKKIPIQIKIVRKNEFVAGARFVNPSIELVASISKQLRAELLAVRVIKISSQYMKPVDRGEAFWFEGEKRSGLYYVVDSGQVVSFALSVLGHIVEWNVDKSLMFGQMGNDSDAKFYDSGSQQNWEKTWHVESVQLVKRFIENIPRVDPKHLSQILDHILKIPTEA